ncbi:hypothetical protein [Cohnella panacarvi]|uniref:hypothetical protein n=1 Tax=Cohnella panacarvi TaxID=400776 RepID=UPI00047A0C55|nr:hypothetical protein [Cohnella panacarvi]
MIKQLPVVKPYISAYKHHALPLSILSYYEENESWICNHYLQLYQRFDFNENVHWLDFYLFDEIPIRSSTIPWLDHTQTIHIDYLKRPIHEFLIDVIDQGSFIYVIHDDYYMPHSFSYNQGHFKNNLLITGYDLDKQCFYVYDYANTTRGQLQVNEVPFRLMEKSIASEHAWNVLTLFTYQSDYRHQLQLELAYRLLQDYVTSSNSSQDLLLIRDPPEKRAFGISVYEQIKRFLHGHSDLINTLHLPFYVFHEHKASVGKLMDNLINKYDNPEIRRLRAEYESVIRDAGFMKTIILKYMLKPDFDIAKSIIPILDSMKLSEERVITSLCEEIQKIS